MPAKGIAMAASAYGVFVPLAMLFAYLLRLGIIGGWLGGAVHIMILASLLGWRYRAGRWKRVEI
jgi:Na+-driven multidrug efflux pump